MKNLRSLILILSGIFMLTSCQKELSLETGVPFGAQLLGSLKDTSGNCYPITVRGTYKVDSTLTDSNYVLIQLNVTTPGNYTIISDSLNGFFFKDSGFIATTGLKTLKLKARGKPVLPIQSVFTIGFGSAFCSFSVEATGTSGGGGGGGSTPITNGDYFPTTPASNWTYKFDLTDDTLRFTVDKSMITIGTSSYSKFIAEDDSSDDTLYYRKGGGLYYEFGNIDFLGVLDSVYNNIDFIFLKDNQAVGGTWESAEVGAIANKVTGTAKLKFTITEKNVKKTISGNIIDSIIVVKREIMFKPTNGTYSSYSSMFVNYAKGAGLLLIEGSLPPPYPPAPYRFEATRFKIF